MYNFTANLIMLAPNLSLGLLSMYSNVKALERTIVKLFWIGDTKYDYI